MLGCDSASCPSTAASLIGSCFLRMCPWAVASHWLWKWLDPQFPNVFCRCCCWSTCPVPVTEVNQVSKQPPGVKSNGAQKFSGTKIFRSWGSIRWVLSPSIVACVAFMSWDELSVWLELSVLSYYGPSVSWIEAVSLPVWRQPSRMFRSEELVLGPKFRLSCLRSVSLHFKDPSFSTFVLPLSLVMQGLGKHGETLRDVPEICERWHACRAFCQRCCCWIPERTSKELDKPHSRCCRSAASLWAIPGQRWGKEMVWKVNTALYFN